MTYVDQGSAHTTTVNVDDATTLFLLVAQKGRAGEIYNAIFEKNVTFKQIADGVAKAVSVSTRSQSFVNTEARMGRFFARFFQFGE